MLPWMEKAGDGDTFVWLNLLYTKINPRRSGQTHPGKQTSHIKAKHILFKEISS